MRVLVLSPYPEKILPAIEAGGHEVAVCNERLTPSLLEALRPEIGVSFGYRFILKPAEIARFPAGIANIHISLLPWNRGADPNLWSVLEDTPKGVSIHWIDAGIDTGDVLAQREVAFGPSETLRTSYDRLVLEAVALFSESWPAIASGALKARPQPPGGSLHSLRDKEAYAHLLQHGWDTPTALLRGQASRPKP